MSCPTLPSFKSTTLGAMLVATVFAAPAALASSPRLAPHEVTGSYDMQDGSTLRIDVVGRRVLVEGKAQEDWTALNPNLLVSPDGQRKIHLLRDVSGKVDRIELHISRAK